MKKKTNLFRLLSYAGGHGRLTVLGCVLSGIAAVLGLAPFVCVWLVARDALAVYPNVAAASGAGALGLDGGMVCRGQHRGVLRRPHVHPHRGLPHRQEHPPGGGKARAGAASGLLRSRPVRAAAQGHRRQRRPHRGSAGSQAARSYGGSGDSAGLRRAADLRLADGRFLPADDEAGREHGSAPRFPPLPRPKHPGGTGWPSSM